jgi:flagellar M-ring protein FliF
MSEFFKQLLAQLSAVWQKLSIQQKVITVSLVGFAFLGLVGLIIWAQGGAKEESGFRSLYSNLELEDAAAITEQLQGSGIEFKLENDGRTVLVPSKKIYEARMMLAREGLPQSRGLGYEIFDKTNLGMTDFVQRLNAQRALEGELQRSIEFLAEVKYARVHIVVPEPTIFLDKMNDAKASVVIKSTPGKSLTKDQIRGISHLVSSSVEGLQPDNISIVDVEGKLLSNPMGSDETALASSRNMELQQNVERYLQEKTAEILQGVLGPGKAEVSIAADLDFDKVERTMEQYDPESRVIRSEERSDETTRNAPDGDHQREKSLTNYEIDKTIEHLIREVGNVKRLTISVVVDGKYVKNSEDEEQYQQRTNEEMADIEDIVKNAVGYDLARGDQISVANVQFDNEFLRSERESMRKQAEWERYMMFAKYGAVVLIIIIFLFLVRSLAKMVAEAMNPPVPEIEQFGGYEEVQEEVPEDLKYSSEILDKVEVLTREEPINIASIIRQWLNEPLGKSRKK